MNWTEKLISKGPQRSLFLCLLFFILFTLAHTSPRSKKVENDLVFDDDNPSELNLILSESKSKNRRVQVQTPSSTRSVPWKSSNHSPPGANRNTRFQSDREEFRNGNFLGNIHNSKRAPLSLRQRKPSGDKRKPLHSGATDLSRRRAVRVPETDDEDLVYSGEDEDGSATRPGGVEIYVPSSTTSGSRSDTQFERRFYRIGLTIGKSWSPALESRTSSAFKIYQQDLERELQDGIGLDVEGIQVIEFKNIQNPAFVTCIFDLGLIGTARDQVEEEFRQYLEVGRIGQLRVREDGFFVKDVGASPESCTDQLVCRNGDCVDISKRCDGTNDCGDGTDEVGCAASSTTTETPDIPEAPTPSPTTEAPPTSSPRPEIGTEGPRIPVPTGSPKEGCRADDQVRCSDGSPLYICSDELCDGVRNCPNGEDEAPEKCRESNCPLRQFQCDLTKCIDESRRCDGIPDCADGTDELCDGLARRCRDDEFQCNDGTCVLRKYKCDRIDHCPDRSDETRDCPCDPNSQFTCGNGFCIAKSRQCDKIRNCQDGSDETEVACKDKQSQPACRPSEFKCGDGFCIPRAYLCNGRYDCSDRSDERNCPTERPTTPPTTSRPSPVTCTSLDFQCDDGSCIDRSMECDSYPDCRDNSDEGPQCSSRDVCSSNEFRCGDGSCISRSLVCNGRSDCSDRSDEQDCRRIPCQSNQFRCQTTGGCIPISAVCDSIPDCDDFSDESNCTVSCRSGEFRCEDGSCIPDYLLCDSRQDCSRGEDELNCRSRESCKEDQFTCGDGTCIPKEYKCDLYRDCPDGSDEQNCNTTPTPTRPQCNENQFSCLAGSSPYCIDIRSRCDQRFDCQDGSDELNCTATTTARPPGCRPDEFTCRSRDQCVPSTSVCNGVVECNDFSDEEGCETVIAPGGLNLKTYPTEQTIRQGHEVVFQCRDEGPLRVAVRWSKGNGQALPPSSRDYNGRLEIPNIQTDHTGTYICEAVGYPSSTSGSRVSVYLRVDQSAGKSPWSPSVLNHYDFAENKQWHSGHFAQTDPRTYATTDIDQPPPTRPPSACNINQATCSNGDCISKSMICDGDLDCPDGSDEIRCHHGKENCEPNEFQCDNRRCVPKTWLCDGDDDCGDSSDERSCVSPPPGSPCRHTEFRCSNGNQCIPKAFHCDKEIDCNDRSDELGCSAPVIQRPPPPLVNIGVGQTFNISCTAVGQPVPEVVWRLNWGHIPTKCVTSSVNGIGYLTCTDIQITDQGAYSCEAINVLGSTFAIPDCILVVQRSPTPCGPGSFNDLAESSRDCLNCFCFGHTTDCGSTDLYISQLPPPENNFRVVGVSQDLLGSGQVEIQDRSYTIPPSILRNVGPRGVQATISNIRNLAIPEDIIPYFALPPSYTGNLLKGFGGFLRYTLRYRGSGRPLRAPDVILSGNGITLLHVGKEPLAPGRDNPVVVRFWAGEWFKRVLGRPGGDQPAAGVEPASREEILMVLADVEFFLIRAQYDQTPSLDTSINDIRLDSAIQSNTGLGPANYVEECRCPAGYLGLSCEDCAPGFERHQQGPWGGSCIKSRPDVQCPAGNYLDLPGQCKPCPCPSENRRFASSCYKDTNNQITCNCNPGHVGRNCESCAPGYQPNPSFPYDCRPATSSCDIDGSVTPYADPVTGRCVCKDLTTGPLCNECKASTFFLSGQNQHGCISCFCMGVSSGCQSSNWYRTQELAVFVNNPLGFILTDESQRNLIRDDFTYDQNNRELGFRGFNRFPTDIYYWQLPYNFLGNKVTSYGGYLNYTVRYVPPPGGQNSPNSAADVEINGNDIRLLYFRKIPISPNKPVEVSVPFIEDHWQRQDGQLANREHLLMALANLDALLIKATYTTSTREAYISNVKMDFAVQRNTGQDRAFTVEQCSCPEGYEGLSCEECSFGYTRSLRGLYLGLCEPCSCNGFSDECDPKTGVCRSCREHTTGDFCDLCEEGYEGDPKTGDCRAVDTRCSCDPRGSVQPDCPDGRNCVCKGNVENPSCNMCRRGTFSLQEINPQGCLECFCSSVTSECSSANLYRSTININVLAGPHAVILTDSTRNLVVEEITTDLVSGELSYVYPFGSKSERLFWSLPAKFTGNRLSSYGGKLRATRRYLVRPGTPESANEDIDVILVGNNGVSLYWIFGISPGQEVSLEVTLRETAGWRHLEGSSKMANREDLLGVLADIQAVLIRATFTDEMESTYIKDISIDDAVKQYTPNGLVEEVEECRCPPGYSGLSCETCSPGHYRDVNNRSKGPNGACLECECGSNAEGCRMELGRVVCQCRPGFSGPNCESRVGPSPTTPPSPVRELQIYISEPNQVSIPAGGSASFRCGTRVSTQGPLRITWSKENGVIPPGRARDDGRGLLVISQTRSEDSGRYICSATDGIVTSIATATLSITSGQPSFGTRPSVTVTPRYATVRANEQVELQCSASGVPQPVITWSSSRGRLPAHVIVSGEYLRIPAARKSDEAEYICTARNHLGTDTNRAILYVQGESTPVPTLPPVGLVASISPSAYEARPGEVVRFRCDTADRTAQIQWSKLSGVLPSNAAQSPDGTLTLYQVRDVDSGVYVCSAVSLAGQSAQAQARLAVSFLSSPPSARITPERQTVDQGTAIEIRCTPTGNPTPTIEWSKVGSTLPPTVQRDNELLRIETAAVSDRGVYVCQVENSAGKSLASAIVEVERRETPLIEMYPSGRQTVVRDGSALFQCRVTAGIPSPTVAWARSDGRPLPRNVEEIEGGVLRFNRVSGEEQGQYVCTAINIVGTTTAIASLDIQIPPNITITPSSPHRVRSGENVRLECRAEGDPMPTVSWTRLQQSRQAEERPGVAGTPFFAMYDINRVSKNDEGSYSCLAKSEAGQIEDRFQLIVDDFDDTEYNIIEPPRPTPRPREEVYYFPVGSRAELRCMQAFEGGIFDQLYLDWARSDRGRMPADYNIRDGVLYVNDLSAQDAGVYTCTARNRQGDEVFSINARLEVVGTSPPQIQLEPARQTVRRGDTVTINCIATGEQPITINWFKIDRRPFPPSVIVNGAQLVFRGIEVSDTGRYVCQATNSGGTSDSVAEVIVNQVGAGGSSGAGVPRPRREQKGYVGSTIDLTCGIGGSQYSWRKDEEELPRSVISFGSTLTLLNLQLSDAGRYVCESEEGTDYIDLSIEVGEYHCGTNEFLCLSGDQCVALSQRCDTEYNCNDHSDELECSDEFNERRRRKRGAEPYTKPVTVRIVPSKDLLRVGDNVELRCEISGDSNPTVRWNKMANGEFQDNVVTYGNVLKIRDVRNENGGVYRCTASTSAGLYEEDYALTIQASSSSNPDRIQNSAPVETRSVPYGSTVTMDCKTELNGPIEYTWSKQGGLINPMFINGQSLTISDATAEDAGTYICTAATSNPFTSVDVTTVLVVTGAVPHFSQAPTSYMTLATLPDSYLKFDIEISFKAEDRNGMIIYNGQKKDGTGDFISFGLSNGYPEFRFDVGSGPAVIRSDRQLDLGEWHSVQLSRSRADGKMVVDGEDVYTRTIHGSFQGLDLMEPLYVGGHPSFNNVHKLAGHTKGFVGCISELTIGGKRQQLFKDSQISRGVSTCETCITNSCTNGGVCQEGLGNRGYSCICPPGYSGENCEISGQSCYPGSCGVGKCVNVPGGFACYCPFGKTGVRCERDVVIYEPNFNSDSYLSYPTPQALKKLKMALKVKPESEDDGLLMYCSQTEDGLGDYTSLAIRDKRLEFQYDTGSGPAVIRSKREVVVGEWVSITIERNLQDGELIIDGSEVNKGKSPGTTRGLNLKTPLYLGGYDKQRVQLNTNVGVVKGFSGCVSELDVGGMEIDIVTSVLEGANVDNCGAGSQFCTKNPCQNGATCENTTCVCATGYSGRHCETRDSCSLKPCQNGGTCYSFKSTYRCSCAKGFFGKDCESAMESWSHSVAFRGEGYIEISKEFMPRKHPLDEEQIEFEISTTAGSGLLLWHGPNPTEVDPDDFFSIGVNTDGKVELQWNYGTSTGKVTSMKSVNDGEKHKIVLKRQGRDGKIEIDDSIVPDFESIDGPVDTLNARGNIYVGGVPNPYQMTHGLYRNGFIGCIHSLKIKSEEPIDLNENAVSAMNTGPCSESDNHANGHKYSNGHPKFKKPNGNSKHGQNGHSKTHNQVIDPDDEDAEEYYLEGRHRRS